MIWKNVLYNSLRSIVSQTAWDDSPLDCLFPATGPLMLGKTPPSAIVVLCKSLLSY